MKNAKQNSTHKAKVKELNCNLKNFRTKFVLNEHEALPLNF